MSILTHLTSQWMLTHTRVIIMSLLVCQYTLGWYHSLRFAPMFFFCFYPWPYLLNIQTFSHEPIAVFIIAGQVFPNLFLKICPLFGQILITCMKCSRASFSLSSYSEKMCWGRGWQIREGISLFSSYFSGPGKVKHS